LLFAATAPTDIYTLSLHDALPILHPGTAPPSGKLSLIGNFWRQDHHLPPPGRSSLEPAPTLFPPDGERLDRLPPVTRRLDRDSYPGGGSTTYPASPPLAAIEPAGAFQPELWHPVPDVPARHYRRGGTRPGFRPWSISGGGRLLENTGMGL